MFDQFVFVLNQMFIYQWEKNIFVLYSEQCRFGWNSIILKCYTFSFFILLCITKNLRIIIIKKKHV